MPEKPQNSENVVNQQTPDLLNETQQLAAINDNLTSMAGLYLERTTSGSRSVNYIVKYKGQNVGETSVGFQMTEWGLLTSIMQNKSLQLPDTVKDRVKNLQKMFGTMERLDRTLGLQTGFEKGVGNVRDIKGLHDISLSFDGGLNYFQPIDSQKKALRLTDLVSMEIVSQDVMSTVVKTVDLKGEEGFIRILPKSISK